MKHLKEYIRGAFQALAWVRMQLANVKKIEDLDKALEQIDKAIETIKERAAVDFTEDIKTELHLDT